MRLQSLICSVLASGVLVAAGTVYAAETPVASKPQVAYASGGVGDDSLEHMQAIRKDFNLKLLFALKVGSYISDVAVTVTDERGNKVLEAVSEGPWFLAKLAPGRYQVTAAYDGESFKRTTTISATGQRELVFRWDRAVERAVD